MPDDKTLVLVEDVTFTDRLETEARKLGGRLTGKMTEEQAAMFSFPTKDAAHDFMFVARQHGHQVTIQKELFFGALSPLAALREDAQRIRRMMKKPGAKPPWARD